ncbi:hypothetical protein ADK44_19460 [Streptomyces rimosus subsp. rimosus]|nr:hypothetical protein ADK44_19460 [Streptomyces rimosus subsp. rimosus]
MAGLGMQEAMAGIDLFGLYRRVRKPLLIVRALRPNPSTPGMPWMDELMAAYVKGLHADLDELARTERWVEVGGVDAPPSACSGAAGSGAREGARFGP